MESSHVLDKFREVPLREVDEQQAWVDESAVVVAQLQRYVVNYYIRQLCLPSFCIFSLDYSEVLEGEVRLIQTSEPNKAVRTCSVANVKRDSWVLY